MFSVDIQKLAKSFLNNKSENEKSLRALEIYVGVVVHIC